ncbi:MAG: tRNA (adenosine(37)-N6)-dimethylallyltransferase MiaA [Planctomycetota bacterium]|nr:MAG: tRNA (adenosine(37)-N6)-dimethylallyltransferase MiaA [Planctomycetota bacterium]
MAVSLAQALDGEIVNADAMAVYRGMDIGTAKLSAAERGGVPHHVLDCIDPEDSCQLSRWLSLAEEAIADIHRRGQRVIVAGGSPLYVKALLEGLSAGTPRDPALRTQLEQRLAREGTQALYAELQCVDPAYASERHPNDHRRVIRALEVFYASGTPYSHFHTTDGIRRSDYRSLLLGLRWDKETLHRRINARCKQMFAAGLVEEVRSLQHRLSPEARQAVGYKEVIACLEGRISPEDAAEQVRRASRHLAKHQLTWLRRFSDLHWLPGDAQDLYDQSMTLINERGLWSKDC